MRRVTGSILILALWTLMVLGFLALAVGGYVAASVRVAGFLQDDARALAQARSGAALAMAEALEAPERFALTADGRPQSWPERYRDNTSLPGGSFSVVCPFAYLDTNAADRLVVVTNYGLVPEPAKINLDDPGMQGSSQRLAAVVGDPELTAQVIAVYPSNKYTRTVGDGAGGEFAVAQRRWSRYGPYEAVPELLAIPGLDGHRFAVLEPLVTLWEFQRWWSNDQRMVWNSFGGVAEGRALADDGAGQVRTASVRRITFVVGIGSNTASPVLTNTVLYWREH